MVSGRSADERSARLPYPGDHASVAAGKFDEAMKLLESGEASKILLNVRGGQ
jgi:hypothetical protein